MVLPIGMLFVIYSLHMCEWVPSPKDGKGTVFTGVCLSTPTEAPQFQVLSQVTGPRSFFFEGGLPQSFLGVPQSWLGWEVYPVSPVRSGWGTPNQNRTRFPLGKGPDGVLTQPGKDWGTLSARTGVIPSGQNSRVNTCYAVGSMPLAFTQEKFLVWIFNVYLVDRVRSIKQEWQRLT